jgi:hypothetical protein
MLRVVDCVASRIPHRGSTRRPKGNGFKAAGLFPFLSPEHHNYPNYYHHRNPRSPYDPDRSPVWYVQKLCHHYCEPANHPPRFALSLHGVRRVGRFNALALLKSRHAKIGVQAARGEDRSSSLMLTLSQHGRPRAYAALQKAGWACLTPTWGSVSDFPV